MEVVQPAIAYVRACGLQSALDRPLETRADDGIGNAHSAGNDSRCFLWILAIDSFASPASAVNSGQRFTAATTSARIDAARPRFIDADPAHATKSARVKLSRFPFIVI